MVVAIVAGHGHCAVDRRLQSTPGHLGMTPLLAKFFKLLVFLNNAIMLYII